MLLATSGLAPDDKWQLALHSDSDHKLSVKRVTGDEDSTCVKNGAAYAFFPLNGVSDNNGWLLNLHYTSICYRAFPPYWNHQRAEDRDRVETQIRRAAAGLASWLEKHPEIRHVDWRLEDLRDSADSPGGVGVGQCLEQSWNESPCDRVGRAASASKLRCPPSYLDKSLGRRPWPGIDPNKTVDQHGSYCRVKSGISSIAGSP